MKASPTPSNAEQPVVILRLHGIDEVGSTFLRVIKPYAANLKDCGGRLILVGLNETVYLQLQHTGFLDRLGKENVYKATSIMGDSALNAYQNANAWLRQVKKRLDG